MSQKLLNLLTRVINSQPTKTGQNNEYMFWSPFVSHHKPKLQINIQTQKWHCWVSESGGHNLFQLFKKVKAPQTATNSTLWMIVGALVMLIATVFRRKKAV